MYFISNQKAYIKNRAELKKILSAYKGLSTSITGIICPSAAQLESARAELGVLRKKNLSLGVQDVSTEGLGAHTGTIPTEQLIDLKVAYAIIGHSEIRARGETAQQVREKMLHCLKNGITPIVCIGEHTRDEAGAFLHAIADEVAIIFADVPKRELESVIICYEPVWAISANAGVICTPAQFEESARYMKKILHDMTGNMQVGKLTFIYGGSINAETVMPFFESELCEGFLVGHASTEPAELKKLISTF